MGNLFGDKLPDADGFADKQMSKAKTLGENNANVIKNSGENQLNNAKGFGESKLNDAKGFGESKLNDAKGFGESKLNDAKGFGESKLNDAKGFGEGKLNDAKCFGEGKLNDAKCFGEGKLNDAKSFSQSGLNGSISFDAASKSSSVEAGGFGGNSSSAFGNSTDNKFTGASGEQASAFSSGENNAGPSAVNTSQSKTSPTGGQSTQSGTPSNEHSKKNETSEDKPYITVFGDTLGSIAKKFHLPSWKYLYQINKSVIGDNPDLLKAGTALKIPKWDTTKGDELIREKGADPFAYVGGLQYRYPWVPLSVTLTDIQGNMLKERDQNGKEVKNFEKEKEYEVIDAESGKILVKGKIKSADELELLVPDVKMRVIKIDSVVFREV
jgi:LysM repeat protein